MMLVTACVIFALELTTLIASPMGYIRSGFFYNFADWARFGLIVAYYVLRKQNNFSLKNGGTYEEIILLWFIMVLVFGKVIFFIRIYK